MAVCVHGVWHWTGLGLLFGASLNLESHSEGFVTRLSVEARQVIQPILSRRLEQLLLGLVAGAAVEAH